MPQRDSTVNRWPPARARSMVDAGRTRSARPSDRFWFRSAASLLPLAHAQAVDVDVEEVIRAEAPDAVRVDFGLRCGMDDGAVDHEVDLVGPDANFERVDRF